MLHPLMDNNICGVVKSARVWMCIVKYSGFNTCVVSFWFLGVFKLLYYLSLEVFISCLWKCSYRLRTRFQCIVKIVKWDLGRKVLSRLCSCWIRPHSITWAGLKLWAVISWHPQALVSEASVRDQPPQLADCTKIRLWTKLFIDMSESKKFYWKKFSPSILTPQYDQIEKTKITWNKI